MTETTEQQLLEMARHCKEVVEEKDKHINYYKQQMEDAEDDLRKIEYLLNAMDYLIEYKKQQKEKNADTVFYDIIKKSIFDLKGWADMSRTKLQVDIEDEDIILMLGNLE